MRMKEYSKKVIAAMVLLWFIIALFGVGVIIYQITHTYSPEYVTLDAIFNYVGIPMTGGIVSYLIKSAVENNQKIKKNGVDDMTDETVDSDNTDKTDDDIDNIEYTESEGAVG